MNVVAEWIADLQEALKAETLETAEVRVGLFYTAVRIATGDVGVAFTPRGLRDTVCCPQTAAASEPAGRMVGRDAWELAALATAEHPLGRAVGVATLNALSSLALGRCGVAGGELRAGVDALAAIGVQPQDRVAMVGAFVPFIKQLRGKVQELWVIDKHPEALKSAELALLRAPTEAIATLACATVVIITGSALIEGGLDDLLAASARARVVALAGPTASPWPPTFFRRGVTLLGGIRITDGPRIMTLVSEGGSGYSFDSAAEKVVIVRDGGAERA
jgi:uncharacterized protein